MCVARMADDVSFGQTGGRERERGRDKKRERRQDRRERTNKSIRRPTAWILRILCQYTQERLEKLHTIDSIDLVTRSKWWSSGFEFC